MSPNTAGREMANLGAGPLWPVPHLGRFPRGIRRQQTTRTQARHILAKLNQRDRTQAVVPGYETGLVTPGRCPPAWRDLPWRSRRPPLSQTRGSPTRTTPAALTEQSCREAECGTDGKLLRSGQRRRGRAISLEPASFFRAEPTARDHLRVRALAGLSAEPGSSRSWTWWNCPARPAGGSRGSPGDAAAARAGLGAAG